MKCSGSFATVKTAMHKTDNTPWAIKCIDKASLAPEDEAALRVEVEVLRMVEHKHIVQLREVFDCQKTFYMVMEEMRGGELFDRIVEREKYTESDSRAVVETLADALRYCHGLGIVHRDLKVAWILLMYANVYHVSLKIYCLLRRITTRRLKLQILDWRNC